MNEWANGERTVMRYGGRGVFSGKDWGDRNKWENKQQMGGDQVWCEVHV